MRRIMNYFKKLSSKFKMGRLAILKRIKNCFRKLSSKFKGTFFAYELEELLKYMHFSETEYILFFISLIVSFVLLILVVLF